MSDSSSSHGSTGCNHSTSISCCHLPEIPVRVFSSPLNPYRESLYSLYREKMG